MSTSRSKLIFPDYSLDKIMLRVSIVGKHILAIDPAKRAGMAFCYRVPDWADRWGGGKWEMTSGHWDLGRSIEGAAPSLLRKMRDVHRERRIDLVAYEAPIFSGPKRSGQVGVAKLCGILEAWSGDEEVDCQQFSPSDIKKFAVGRGDADKDAMMWAMRCATRDSIACESADHADAFFLLWLALTRCQEASSEDYHAQGA